MAEKKIKTVFSVRFKKANEEVIQFAMMQSNFSDAITYLIEKEIAENGFRNLADHIPMKRNLNYLLSQISEKDFTEEIQKPQKNLKEKKVNSIGVLEKEKIKDKKLEIPIEYLDM